MLFLATLLHDVGKAIGGKDHSRRGAAMARVILTRLGLAQHDVDEACHLILHHLAMYLVAVRRDIEDSATIEEFSRQVHGKEGLRDLYLLTVADLSTTAPTSMTPWKARMLDELFFATDTRLAGRSGSSPALLSRVCDEVKKHWGEREHRDFLDEFLRTMPERYLRSNAPAAIAAHAQVALDAQRGPVSVALVPSRHPDVAELCVVAGGQTTGAGLCVVAGDRPGLLAAITAALVASKLEVHAAEVHSRTLPDGRVQAVDLFWAWDRTDGAEGVSNALPKLANDLRQVITGQIAPRDLLARRKTSRWSERPLPSVTTEVVIDDRASPGHTVIEVLTKDRPGLLFTLAQALYELGLTITVAKINTEGSRVADVFYVTETDGRKLDPGARTQEVRERLFNALRPTAS
jgi:[protein-PII] uridylyltransferase